MKKTICIAAVITVCFVIAIFAGSGEDTKGIMKGTRSPQLETTQIPVPNVLNYQGVLTDADDNPLDGTYNLTFRIYSQETGGTSSWDQTQTVTVYGGLFNVVLPIPKEHFVGSDRWLGVEVVGDPDGEMKPRQRISSVPYAYRMDEVYVNDDGNVGIGTIFPDTKLDVIDMVRVKGCSWPALGQGLELAYSSDLNKGYIQAYDRHRDLWGDLYLGDGDVGIGTSQPRTQLHVLGRISTGLDHTSAGAMTFYPPDGKTWFHIDNGPEGGRPTGRLRISHGGNPGDNEIMSITQSNNVGIGTTDPGNHRLYVESSGNGTSGATVLVKNTNPNKGIGMFVSNEANNDVTMYLEQHGDGGILKCASWTGGWHEVFKVENDGKTICSVLQITGGSDIAEPFDIVEPDEIEPGMVVVIDPENPEKLKISDRAYDRCVAGIVSGAGGIKPGMMLTQEDAFEGNHQVALTGRVYGLCDASYDSIEPGDLLTTSPTPGYAMKVTDYEMAQGAILGKAMTKLEEGQGLVLVLVALQ